jgi:predicted SnoaL-like aldol condensation-catalyzing enzyme
MSDSNAYNRQLVMGYYELVFNRHRPDQAAQEYLSSDYVHHRPGCKNGPEGFVEYFANYFSKYPDFQATVNDSIAEGDLVALRADARIARDRPVYGVAEFYRLRDGKISEHWHVIEAVAGDNP